MSCQPQRALAERIAPTWMVDVDDAVSLFDRQEPFGVSEDVCDLKSLER